MQSRYYDPEVGRFISQDSVEYADPETINGLNLYAYCGNNPVMNVDPSGSAWWQWLLGAVAVVALCAIAVGVTVLTGGTGTLAFAVATGALKGAAIGFGVGAVAGTAIGAISGGIYSAVTGADFWSSVGQGALLGLGMGAFAGVVIGAVIGGAVGGMQYHTFASTEKLNLHFSTHAKEFEGLYATPKVYVKGAKYVIKNGTYVPEMNGYIRFFGSGGGANYAFVGLTENGARITTFGIRSVTSLIKSGVVWLII